MTVLPKCQVESSVISRDNFWMMQCRALALVQLQPSNVDFKPREAVLLCYEIVVYDRRSSQMLWSCTSSHSILACMPLKLLWQVLWCSSHSIPACMPLKLLWQVLWCLSNCRDVPTLNFAIKRFGATNFGWNNIVPLHNSTLSNVDIKQMWCLVLALSQLSKWTGDVKISGEFAPCRIHNWLWLAVDFATVECRR